MIRYVLSSLRALLKKITTPLPPRIPFWFMVCIFVLLFFFSLHLSAEGKTISRYVQLEQSQPYVVRRKPTPPPTPPTPLPVKRVATARSVTPSKPSTVPVTGVRALGKQMTIDAFGEAHWPAMDALVNKESGWRPSAQNKHSSAYGLFQFLSGSWHGTGYQKSADPEVQLKAGIVYIKRRYGNPTKALAFHRAHNWY